MATELEGNVKLQRFIELLAALNQLSVEMIKTGEIPLLPKINVTIAEMYSIQHGGEEEAYTAIEEDMQIIYKNCDAITVMLQSNDKEEVDEATSAAVKKFVRNIFEATVRIVYAYGLA